MIEKLTQQVKEAEEEKKSILKVKQSRSRSPPQRKKSPDTLFAIPEDESVNFDALESPKMSPEKQLLKVRMMKQQLEDERMNQKVQMI